MGKFEKETINIKRKVNEFSDRIGEGTFLADRISGLMDKSFYDRGEDPERWRFPERDPSKDRRMNWVHLARLPVEIDGSEEHYRAKERMQGLLCTEQGMGHTIAYQAARRGSGSGNSGAKKTELYIGVETEDPNAENIILNQLKQNIRMNITGAGIEDVGKEKVEFGMTALPFCGVITGQPSTRFGERENPLQTLDKITAGIRNQNTGRESEYVLTILSEPVKDEQIKEILDRANELKTELSAYAAYTESRGYTETQGKSSSVGGSLSLGGSLIALLATAACLGTGFGLAGTMLSGITGSETIGNMFSLGGALFGSRGSSKSISNSKNISVQHVNYNVNYCTALLDKLIERLEAGRNMGFWNTGIYVLGDSPETVELVMATARSIYAGQNTYQEPLRLFQLGENETAAGYMKHMQHLPLPVPEEAEEIARNVADSESWHIFGPLYEGMTTPMTTEELSIVMSLPRKDVPGIRIRKNAVEFATNPPAGTGRTVPLGNILDMGTDTRYGFEFDLDQINRHVINVGANGGGKSTTTRAILRGVMKYGIPFLVIDPVKTDYVYWADQYNREHRNDLDFRKINIYAPGLSGFPGIETELGKIVMNPFQPYAAKGAPLNIPGHADRLSELLGRTMAMGDFLPMLFEEGLYQYIAQEMGEGVFLNTAVSQEDIEEYPKLSGLKDVIREILQERSYSKENTDNFNAAITTRINSLTRGWKKDFFEAERSTPAEEIFEKNTVICLAGVTSNADKAFLMLLILQGLEEYRVSKYQYDPEYRAMILEGRKKYSGNCLAHMTIVEEAHRILKVPSPAAGDADPQAAAADKFCEMLSEIREPGEGLMIIDQYPSRLIPDAIKNTNVKIIHRLLARDDREAMAGCMSLTEEQSRLLATLKRGDAIIGSEQEDSAMWIHVYKPTE